MGDALDDGFEAYDLEVDTEEFADDDEVSQPWALDDEGVDGHPSIHPRHPLTTPSHTPHTAPARGAGVQAQG